MNYTELYKKLEGKTGTIYAARQGTVLVFCLPDATYLISTTAANGKVVENPAPAYWTNSIDFSGSFSDYFTYNIAPSARMPYPAEPITPITAARLAKLQTRAKALGK